jgi:DNA-binding transcriptional regulator LsrR (DeoR family)
MIDYRKQTPEPERFVKGVRALTPIWDKVASEDDVVIQCARAFAAAFEINPAQPQLKEIAQEAHCSRNVVKKHLAEAKRRGMLSINLQLPKNEGLSQRLAKKYGLAEAVVTLAQTMPNDQNSIRSALAPEAMHYLERFCIRLAEQRGEGGELCVGVDGGQTLYQAAREARFPQLPQFKYKLIPLVFGPLGASLYTASTVANILGSKLEAGGADVLVQDGFAIKADWSHTPDKQGKVHFTIDMTGKKTLSQMDLLFVGIGSQKAGLLKREIDLLPRNQKARMTLFGDILNIPFDQKGEELAPLAQSRAVLLNLNDLQSLSRSQSTLVVGVAGGEDKLDAIRTVLRYGYISVLITEYTTAVALVEA